MVCQQMAKRQQRITLAHVAREAGVSQMTVSRVMNNTGRISEQTRQHVREVIERLGYRPSRAARTLVTNTTYMIGVVVPDITNPYFSEIVQGIEDVAWEHGYSVLLTNTNENLKREEAVLDHLDESTVDGIILCSSRLPDPTLMPLIEKHSAVVVVNREVPDHLKSRVSVVVNRYGIGNRAMRAIEYMAKIGRKNIGYVRLERGAAYVRLDYFMEKLEAEGLVVNPDWYVTCSPVWDAGYEAAKSLLQKNPELDAIIGGNDLVTLGAMYAAHELGRRIPDDLVLIGGDDILTASLVTPPLTTFGTSKYLIGEMTARLLLARMEGDTTYREYLYEEELIIRGSA